MGNLVLLERTRFIEASAVATEELGVFKRWLRLDEKTGEQAEKMISVTVSGGEKFVSFLRLAPQIIRNSADETCGVVAEMIAVRAKQIVPVRTGTLQRSIMTWHLAPMVWAVATRVYYGIFVEYGTSRMQAHPFLRPALAEYQGVLSRVFIEKVNEFLARL